MDRRQERQMCFADSGFVRLDGAGSKAEVAY
jgi:hypothetical protein